MLYAQLIARVQSEADALMFRNLARDRDVNTFFKLQRVFGDGLLPDVEHHERALEDLRGRVAARLERWDVRHVGVLRDCFPSAFPPDMRTGSLNCFVGDDGKWRVEAA